MIITLEDATNIDPNVTQGQLDAYETAIRQLTANNFQVKGARFCGLKVSGLTFTVDTGEVGILRKGDTLQVTDAGMFESALIAVESTSGVGITVTDKVNDGGKLVDGEYPHGFATLVRYPADVVEGMKRLVEYDRDMKGKLGIKSETISRMSTTYYDVNAAEAVDGYPASLMSFLRKYEKMRWGS
jgi:hypothetical protein